MLAFGLEKFPVFNFTNDHIMFETRFLKIFIYYNNILQQKIYLEKPKLRTGTAFVTKKTEQAYKNITTNSCFHQVCFTSKKQFELLSLSHTGLIQNANLIL